MVRFKKWIQLDFGILRISLHVYVGIIGGDACSHSRIWIQLLQICILYLVRDWKGYDSSIHYLDKIYWVELGYIPFHYPDMRIQINWYHLVDLQGNKREFWISFLIYLEILVLKILLGSKFLAHLVSCYRGIWNHAVTRVPSLMEEIEEIMRIKETMYV